MLELIACLPNHRIFRLLSPSSPFRMIFYTKQWWFLSRLGTRQLGINASSVDRCNKTDLSDLLLLIAYRDRYVEVLALHAAFLSEKLKPRTLPAGAAFKEYYRNHTAFW
ncbi:hypothetical protein NL676_023324 [Syzygium grande]|nr:hypothetical protein NL676_023324 [Syzygium grande]